MICLAADLTAGGVRMNNPRSSAFRRKTRARMTAAGEPCGICRGRLGPIHYDEPSDAKHPLSFVIDEIKPISRFREFGYASREAAAKDPDNVQAAHWICNSRKSNFVSGDIRVKTRSAIAQDGSW